MLLLSSSPRVEEVVYALEGSISLSSNLFSAFSERVLKLDVGKTGEHLVSVDALGDLLLPMIALIWRRTS